MYTFTFCKTVQKSTTFLLEVLKSKNLTIPLSSEDVQQHELTFTAGGNKKNMVQPIWKIVWHFLTTLNIVSPYD